MSFGHMFNSFSNLFYNQHENQSCGYKASTLSWRGFSMNAGAPLARQGTGRRLGMTRARLGGCSPASRNLAGSSCPVWPRHLNYPRIYVSTVRAGLLTRSGRNPMPKGIESIQLSTDPDDDDENASPTSGLTPRPCGAMKRVRTTQIGSADRSQRHAS